MVLVGEDGSVVSPGIDEAAAGAAVEPAATAGDLSGAVTGGAGTGGAGTGGAGTVVAGTGVATAGVGVAARGTAGAGTTGLAKAPAGGRATTSVLTALTGITKTQPG
jgi:hypothetical protein